MTDLIDNRFEQPPRRVAVYSELAPVREGSRYYLVVDGIRCLEISTLASGRWNLHMPGRPDCSVVRGLSLDKTVQAARELGEAARNA